MLTTLLALTAFAAGVTGAWSPCGFSMVETLAGAGGRDGPAGRRLVRISAATFSLGALAGGAVTFTTLAALGALLGAGGAVALAVAAAVALAAAVADALGARIVPQIRRQVPEPWRRTLPLPLAAGLYGVLLGLGFTTFVLAFAVWALAGIAIAVGAPAVGLLIGVAFGLGRALPVVALAPRYATQGERLAARMAEEPRLLRRIRVADALLLAACSVALAVGAATSTAAAKATVPPRPAAADAPAERTGPGARPAHAVLDPRPPSRRVPAGAAVLARGARDPSVAGAALLWVRMDGGATLRTRAARRPVPDGGVAAIGGPWIATASGTAIAVARRTTGAAVATLATAAAPIDLSVSRTRVAWREPTRGGGERIVAASLTAPGGRAVVARARDAGTLSRPAVDGDRLVFAVATPHGSRIVERDLRRDGPRVRVRSRRTQLSHPALRGRALLHVEASACDQRLLLRRPGRPPRTLLRLGGIAQRDGGREHGRTRQGSLPTSCPRGTPRRSAWMLWSTALARRAAYVTLWDTAARRGLLVRVAR